jgi:hypothetical protein
MIQQALPRDGIVLQTLIQVGLLEHDPIVDAGATAVVSLIATQEFAMGASRAASLSFASRISGKASKL